MLRRRFLATGLASTVVGVLQVTCRRNSEGRYLHIGDVALPIASAHAHPERIPNVLSEGCKQFFPMTSETRAALRWMAQKELLGQDMCLIGEPGPLRRWLALTYCHYAKREVQIQFLSRDTTDADLKQRKEIANGSLTYAHQAAVQAALNGQVLILEGLERAERNVLPIINNLLENREMHLDDGRSIIHPQRYDSLLRSSGKANLDHLGLLRCHENFRVIALTVPVPRYPGNPLDPPLRSRFQSFYLHPQSDPTDGILTADASKSGSTIAALRAALKASDAGGSDNDTKLNIPPLGSYEAVVLQKMVKLFPKEAIASLLPLVYPWELFCRNGAKMDVHDRATRVVNVLKRYQLLSPVATLHHAQQAASPSSSVFADLHASVLTQLKPISFEAAVATPARVASATFLTGETIQVAVGQFFDESVTPSAAGESKKSSSLHNVVMTQYFQNILSEMILSHACSRHILLVGEAGCGKSSLMHRFADTFGYATEVMHMFADMSTRDLLQRRVTCPSTGDTRWELSPLMTAAKFGHLAVLDGVDNMPSGMLSILQELLVDGSVTLPDGAVFKSYESFVAISEQEGLNEAQLAAKRVYCVHPSFRVVATAKPPTLGGKSPTGAQSWLTSEVPAMFNVVNFPALPHEDALAVLTAPGPSTPSNVRVDVKIVNMLLQLQQKLRGLQVTDPKIPQLTLRHLVHVAFYASQYPEALGAAVESALLLPLVATVTRTQLCDLMSKVGIVPTAVAHANDTKTSSPSSRTASPQQFAKHRLAEWFGGASSAPSGTIGVSSVAFLANGHRRSVVHNGRTVLASERDYSASEAALVPHVSGFVPNHQQDKVLGWIASHIAYGSRLLLVGTQGVGKNKVVDYFLMQVGLPRHYIQLHRDTTVGSLTTTPTVVGGKVIWEDSPLVKAVKLGHVLVVDEDSPLVKAVKLGHVLVVDEVDKAPVEVVQVLKGLIEDQEMFLSDGRRIVHPSRVEMRREVAQQHSGEIVPLHPDFRIIVLANPPGYPFHGNDFYRVCGDLFQTYVLQNPDAASQLKLLASIAPSVPESVLSQLIEAFGKLTKLCENGSLNYPFSLRELIAVVKHLKAFPQDGLFQALNNVFNFDLMDENTMTHVRRVLHETLSRGSIRLTSSLPVGAPLNIDRAVVPSGGLFEGPEVSLPTARHSIGEASRYPYHASVQLSENAVRVASYTSDELQVQFPDTFSEIRATSRLPFLEEAGPGGKVLKVVSAARDLVYMLYTSDDLAAKRSVGVAAMMAPGHGSSGVTGVLSLLPVSACVLVTLPLAAFVDGTSTSAHLDLRSNGTMLGEENPSVVVLDTESSRFIIISAIDLMANKNTSHEELAQEQQQQDQTKTLNVYSIVSASPAATSVHRVTWDPVIDVISTAAAAQQASSTLHIIPAASTDSVSLERLEVTLPGAIERAHFFSPAHAHVVFHSATGTTRHGILKVPSLWGVGSGTSTLRLISSSAVQSLDLDNPNNTFVTTKAMFRASPSSPADGATLEIETSRIVDNEVEGAILASTAGYAVVAKDGAVDRYSIPSSSSNHRGAAQVGGLRGDSTNGQVVSNTHVFDVVNSTAWVMPKQLAADSVASGVNHDAPSATINAVHQGASGGQVLSSAQRDYSRLTKEYAAWKGLLEGNGGGLGAPPTPQELDMWYSKPRKEPSGSLKHGKEDPANTPHVGGNSWAGGTGGTDTAGLGGLVGPYRLDKGHTVHQVSPEDKKKVPQHIIDEARKMGKEALAKRLKEIGMTEEDHSQYQSLVKGVQGPIAQLQNMLSGLKAKEGERMWARHQSDGVWDDAKVVEGITGERNIYKRRIESSDPNALQHKKKKRLLFVMDVSASMYRFNGMDQRLHRLIESATMVMEAFVGQEEKIDYAMVGHNGDSDSLPLVQFGRAPQNKKERMEVCQKMIAYAQYCWSGDNTVNAMYKAVTTVTQEDADSYFVFVISDANLAQYGISPVELARIIRSDDRVNMYCIFIASMGQQSSHLQKHLPAGHGFECFDTKQLPLVMSQIFISTDLLGGM
ncbi:GPI-anchored surface protein, putative [Bodo saltans]|uniref:GPI-anchored surface protein, putative n=1 Tax=Bodo saltans TaxID=75058 RepID=A0A0S4J956_BODSA|nr:GPI-anchored surface protein, putative [Bodo saltans]|eukprot:CUG86776.1 GPI-anchored surface protein, putative [Bodo saltans]